MTDKTLEELVVEFFPNHKLTKYRWSFELMQFSADDLIEFGRQIREATKAECKNIALQDDIVIVGDITTRIESLPIDRIKTEK